MLVAQLQMEGDARAVPLSQHVGTWVFNGVRSHTSPKSSMLISTGTADVSTQKEQGSAVPQALHTARANPCLGSRNPSAIGVHPQNCPARQLPSRAVECIFAFVPAGIHPQVHRGWDANLGAESSCVEQSCSHEHRALAQEPGCSHSCSSGSVLRPPAQRWGMISRLISHPHVPQYSRPQGHQLLREEQTPQGGTSQFGTHDVLVWGQAPWIASAPVLHPLQPHRKCPHQLPLLSRHPTHCCNQRARGGFSLPTPSGCWTKEVLSFFLPKAHSEKREGRLRCAVIVPYWAHFHSRSQIRLVTLGWVKMGPEAASTNTGQCNEQRTRHPCLQKGRVSHAVLRAAESPAGTELWDMGWERVGAAVCCLSM